MGYFDSDEEINVSAQRSPFINQNFVNPVDYAMAQDLYNNQSFIDVLLDEVMPTSYTVGVNKLLRKIEDGSFNAYGFPTIGFGQSFATTLNTLPIFWIRRDNLDLDSAWWNFEAETGLNFSRDDKVSPANKDYWLREANDPDINRIPNPDEGDVLLSAHPELVEDLQLNNEDLRTAIPYEVVYPEWFKLHPEFLLVSDTLKDFGLDVQENILKNIRSDKESSKNVDHLMVGFFQGLLPKSDGEAEYIFRFMREIFKDQAFVNPLPKLTSPCITNAVDSKGFHKYPLIPGDETLMGAINSGATLPDLKANNYYYEYSAAEAGYDLDKIFRFTDPTEKVRIDLFASDVIIRKVRGVLPDKKRISVTVGKGATFPEFTYFGEVPYPVDPTSPTSGNAAYNSAVLFPHITLFGGVADLFNETLVLKPLTYVSVRVQKTNFTKFPDWDKGTTGDLSPSSPAPYYEEIIIVNPRMRYRGTYSESFVTKHPYLTFYDYEYPQILDNPDVYLDSGIAYVLYTSSSYKGARFLEKTSEADGLAIPVLQKIILGMVFKFREEILAKSFCLLTIAIQVTEVKWYEKEEFFQLVQAAFFVANLFSGGAFVGVQAFVEALLVTVILTIGASLIAAELIELLVEEFGFEAGGIIAAIVTIVALYYKIKLPTDPSLQTQLALETARNFSESYVDLVDTTIELENAQFKSEQEKRFADYEALREELDEELLWADPNITATTFIYSPPDETPSEFYNRVIGNLNPLPDLYKLIETQVSRSTRITHTGLPEIATEEPSLLDRLDTLK